MTYKKKKTLKHLLLNVHIRFLARQLPFFSHFMTFPWSTTPPPSVREGTETPVLFMYETFNLARVALLAIVAMIVGLA